MSDSTGWIRLHRRMLESRIYSDPDARVLFLHLLLTANWKAGYFNGELIPPGSRAISIERLGEELKWSRSKCYRVLKRAQEYGSIEQRANNRFTVVSLCNWRTYQSRENAAWTTDEQRANNGRTTGEQQPDTIEEGKKDKKERTSPPSALGEDWETLAVAMAGVVDIGDLRGCLTAARDNGATVPEVRAIVAHWRSHTASSNGKSTIQAWTEGALVHRIRSHVRGTPPDKGWPPVSAGWKHYQKSKEPSP